MFENLFKKKPNERAIKKFWKEFEERADLYLNILETEDANSDDSLWMNGLVKKSIKPCVIDTTVGFEFSFDRMRDPKRFVFHHQNDDYLMQVAAKMEEYYPKNLLGKIEFLAVE